MLVCLSVCQLAESFDLGKFKHINVRDKQVSGLHYSSAVCMVDKPLLKMITSIAGERQRRGRRIEGMKEPCRPAQMKMRRVCA